MRNGVTSQLAPISRLAMPEVLPKQPLIHQQWGLHPWHGLQLCLRWMTEQSYNCFVIAKDLYMLSRLRNIAHQENY